MPQIFMSDAVGIYSVLCIMSVISLTESVNLQMNEMKHFSTIFF